MISLDSRSETSANSVALVFLGTRGGGPELLLQIVNSLVKANKKVTLLLSGKNENLYYLADLNLDLIIVNPPNSKLSAIFGLFRSKRELDRLVFETNKRALNSFFFVQPHYWDYFIVRNLIRIGKQVTYTVHDYPPHRGEIFPPKFLTKKIAKTATRVIALNNECHQLLLKLNSNTVRSKLPRFFQSSETIQNKIWDVAYVGRIKKYKGLKNLSKAFQLLNTSSLRILVAGRGGLGTTFGAEVHLLNRWLTRDEVINNIRGTRVLVLPYLEATQSGIIELAKAFEVTVVVTPVANLLEQVMDGGIGVIARSHKPHDLADAIMCALAGKAITYEKNPLILALDRFILEDLNHGMDR